MVWIIVTKRCMRLLHAGDACSGPGARIRGYAKTASLVFPRPVVVNSCGNPIAGRRVRCVLSPIGALLRVQMRVY
jgi:hypothetical protein